MLPVVEVKSEVIEALTNIASHSIREDCGVLVGSLTTDGKYRISKVSPSCSEKSKASRCGCIRNAAKANAFVQSEFENSNFTRVYFGEWHTHPERIPQPSKTDKAAIVDIFNRSTLPIEIVFLAIAGWDKIYWGYYDGYTLKKVDVIVM